MKGLVDFILEAKRKLKPLTSDERDTLVKFIADIRKDKNYINSLSKEDDLKLYQLYNFLSIVCKHKEVNQNTLKEDECTRIVDCYNYAKENNIEINPALDLIINKIKNFH